MYKIERNQGWGFVKMYIFVERGRAKIDHFDGKCSCEKGWLKWKRTVNIVVSPQIFKNKAIQCAIWMLTKWDRGKWRWHKGMSLSAEQTKLL